MTTQVVQSIFDPTHRMRPLKIARSRRVNRQLFPVDHEQTRKFLEAELSKIEIQKAEMWDFDFVKGKPLQVSEAKYEWFEVPLVFAPKRPRKPEPEPDITNLYASPVFSTDRVQDENLLQIADAERHKDEDKTKNNKQTKITDFMAIRKRNIDTNSKKSSDSVIPQKISKCNDVTS